MNEELWFEELLLPPPELAEEAAKSLERMPEARLAEEKALDLAALRAGDKAAYLRHFTQEVRGILRAHRPRWRRLTPEEAARFSIPQGDLYLVRLGMELDVPPAEREAGWSYEAAWWRTYLFNPRGEVQPRALAVYPERLYEGEPTMVRVQVGLGLKAGPLEATLGELSGDLHLGQVTPVTVGFLGEEQQAPYWELRAREKPILGIYHFWLVVERPPGCAEVRLAAQGEGNLRARHFILPVGPRERAWSERVSIALTDGEGA